MINNGIRSFIEQQLSSIFLKDMRISRCNSVGGGSINQAWQVVTESGQLFFLKCNTAETYPGLFKEERKGLEYLQQYVRTPAVLFEATSGGQQLLLMEWITPGARTAAFWKKFGEDLAGLHRQSQPQFGFRSDNYMGSLPQINTYSDSWTGFFAGYRLRPQAELAARNGLLPVRWLKALEKLYTELPSMFPEEPPSLLHGDLWRGNFICDQHAAPVLIDPAVYYGHRSIDLAMTTLFGRFNQPFYEAYHYHYPLPSNYEEQWSIANLYPLLIHLNLFGSGYLASITETLRRWKD